MKINNETTAFRAGLTYSMKREIGMADIPRISAELSKKGIETDFKQNRVVGWASKKCVEFIEDLNQHFGLELGMPKGIFVEDFRKLNITKQDSAGFCNMAPTKLYTEREDIVPEKTIFFNSFEYL